MMHPSVPRAPRAEEFDAWFARCDRAAVLRWGLSLEDLEDMAYYSMFEDGLTPTEVISLIREELGAP